MVAATPAQVDFGDLQPSDQILGELLGAGRGLSNYLFDPNRAQFTPPPQYIPTLDDAPGVQEAIAAARSGLGAYQDYFSRGRDLLDSAATQAGQAGAFAQSGIDAGTARLNQAIAQAQAAQALSQAQATDAQSLAQLQAAGGAATAGTAMDRGILAAQTAMGREQSLSDQAVLNALGTQQAATALAGPGGVSAFMNPYQEAVIDQTLRRLNEQGAMAEDRADAAAVQAGAFGGSRAGVQRALLADRLQETKADTLNQLLSQNFLQAQRAAQQAAQLNLSGGQLGQQAFSTATGRALGSGQLGTSEAANAGRLGLGIGQLGSNVALQGGQLGSNVALQGGQLAAQTGLNAARQDLAGGQLQAQTALGAGRAIGALGQGIGQLGAQGALTDQRGAQQLAQLGAIPMNIAQQAAEAQRGQAIEQEYFPIRDFGIVGDFFRGVPTSQSLPFQQASTGQTNPFLGALGGGITGLQVGQLFGNQG